MEYKEMITECEAMQEELQCVIPADLNDVVDHATKLAVYMARSGQMLADAKKMARKKKSSEIADVVAKIAKEGFLCATAQKALVESIAEEEMYLVDWIERINRTCTHNIDLCRSIISKGKEEMKYLNLQ